MKSKPLFIALCVLLCCIACSKENSSGQPSDQPVEVENYFRVEIDGELWEASMGAIGTYLNQGQIWGVTSIDSEHFMKLTFNGPYEDSTYVWNENTVYYGRLTYQNLDDPSDIYSTLEVLGQALVSFDSLTTTYARGSFEMHGVNENGDTLNFSNGEFQCSMEETPSEHLDSSIVSMRIEPNEFSIEYQYFTTTTAGGGLGSIMTRDDSSLEFLSIAIPTTIANSVTYPLSSSSIAEISWRENDFIPKIYSTSEDLGSGELTVDSVIENRIMGTFFFTADDGNGNLVHVEEGEFDIYFD